MICIPVNVKLFEFKELTKGAKRKAIEYFRIHLIETTYPDEFEYIEDDHTTIEDYEINDESIIDLIEANNYLFCNDGSLADIIYYCGKHPKAGIIELKFMDQFYNISKAVK